jgi:hypothetical protein
VDATERHARNLARVAELEAEGRLFEPYLALARGVIERHAPIPRYPDLCSHCREGTYSVEASDFPCADYLAAENALGVGDE